MYKSQSYATRTRQSYRTHRKCYLRFCAMLHYNPVPASTPVICRYAAFLARTHKFNSIKQYMNIIRLMHLEWDLPNPLENNFHIQHVLRGVRRNIGDCVTQKLPITPAMLHRIRNTLDLSQARDANVWAICLVLFFGLLRKSSVLPVSRSLLSPSRVLTRSDITFSSAGMCLRIRNTKTIQHGERVLTLPMPMMVGHALCPVQATFNAFKFCPQVPATQPAFCVLPGVPITGPSFDARLRSCLATAGFQPSRYSGHSLRRAGATWCFQVGVPAETIRALGDWRSSCYLQYISMNNNTIFNAVRSMQQAL